MNKKNMDAEDLYLASEDPKGSYDISPSDVFGNKARKKLSNVTALGNPIRIEEIPERRGNNVKIFRMSDGTEQAVFSPSDIHVFDEETHMFEDIENTLAKDEDGKHFTCGKNHFIAKFSREEDNDDIFFIERGEHKLTICARKNKKNKNKGVTPHLYNNIKDGIRASDVLTFADIEPDTDYEYSVEGDGIKENIVVKKPSAIYRYPFVIRCKNLAAKFDEKTNRIAFIGKENGEEIFFIPAPFMSDANGVISTDVTYEVKNLGNGTVNLTVIADSQFMNADDRAFPVVIDPQVKLSGTSYMTSFSWENDILSAGATNIVGTRTSSDGTSKRVYLNLKMPSLPRNPRIKKAELVFYQKKKTPDNTYTTLRMGLFRTKNSLTAGSYSPDDCSELIDYVKVKPDATSYTFDVTTLIDEAINDGVASRNLVIKMLDENITDSHTVELHGSSTTTASCKPQLIVTYESSYAVNASYRTHTHELGRFGQGSIDLQCGNLMFESEDFAWSGNRMPVTIKHLYNSILADKQYTGDSSIGLRAADFTGMNVGLGFKLNIMQSMVPVSSFLHKGVSYSGGYVYVDDNGEETYFKTSSKTAKCSSNTQCYPLYEDVNGTGMIYDPNERVLTTEDNKYFFDNLGRLIQINDSFDNDMRISYTSGKITSVTDGAGREFRFNYSGKNLMSIATPDYDDKHNSIITYTYDINSHLTSVTYPDGKVANIGYANGDHKPSNVTLLNSGAQLYKVAYKFSDFNLDRIQSVTEYGANNELGMSSSYDFSISSSKTYVTTVEPEDSDSDINVITTVYTFDDDGNIISEYINSKDTGNIGGDGEESGVNPFSADGGAGTVSNANNLLLGHAFQDLTYWTGMPENASNLSMQSFTFEPMAKFSDKALRIQSYNSDCIENGIYQTSIKLPAGKYTFSAYVRPLTEIIGGSAPGTYIRVTDISGNLIATSEKLNEKDSEHTRLIVPFALESAQSVQVQILINGKGTVSVNAAQLENNPYASAYNMLENGSFENGTSGWSGLADSDITDMERFHMRHSYRVYGNPTRSNILSQKVYVKSDSKTRETFTLSGWAKGYGIPDNGSHKDASDLPPQFCVRAEINYTGGEVEMHTAEFSPCTRDWQFASVQFAKKKRLPIQYIKVACYYSNNSGEADFDNIQLIRNGIERDLDNSDFVTEDTSEYEEETEETTIENDETTDKTPTFEEYKDIHGNALTETTFTDGEFGTIYRSFEFDADHNNLIRETDARGNNTLYTVDEDTSRNEEVIDRLGNKTAYEYDDSGRTTKVTSKIYEVETEENKNPTVSYAYDAFDNMTEIVRGDGMKYALAYNEFRNLESIGIEGKSENLIQYTYKNGNGRLKQMTYANGDTMKATYNSIGQMIAERWYNPSNRLIASYRYVYDDEGNIVRSIDMGAEKEYNYNYEEGRLARATESDITLYNEMVTSKTVINTTKYYYDTEGKMTKKVIAFADGSAHTIHYETNDDNTAVKFSAGGRTVTSHSKSDSFGRKIFDELQLGTDFVSRQFVYYAGKVTDEHKAHEKVKSSATTQLVSQIILSDGRTLSYEYDAEERITSITEKYTVDKVETTDTTSYTYDALGQLLTETNVVQTIDRSEEEPVVTVTSKLVNSMEYDNYGNIKTKNGIEYTYDTTWKDLLTQVGTGDNNTISYDDQGNPVKYLGHDLEWEKGRQLKKFDNNTYTYNANGIRTSKIIRANENDEGVTHTYTLDGTKILRETWDGNTLVPLYDNEDSVCGILYNTNPYYFIKNLQGDVIAIVDKDAKTVARYSYDAWGVPKIDSDSSGCSIATINPFRYRGYYFDEEIKLYYLQSRYYDASVGRFINSDESVFVNIDINLLIYSDNDPIDQTDPTGCFSFARAWLSVPLDMAFMVLSPYLAPVKAFAKKYAGYALKTRISSPLINLLKRIANMSSKLLQTVKNVVNKIPRWGKQWAKKINVQKISRSIAGATASMVFNTILNAIVSNITIFLSVGGFIAGFLDILSDKKLNNKITIPFVW